MAPEEPTLGPAPFPASAPGNAQGHQGAMKSRDVASLGPSASRSQEGPSPRRAAKSAQLVRRGATDADPFASVWANMMGYLKANHPMLVRQWFDELEPVGIAGGALEVRAATPLHRDYLRRSCADAFNDAARTVTGRLLAVRFLGPADESQSAMGEPARSMDVASLAAHAPRIEAKPDGRSGPRTPIEHDGAPGAAPSDRTQEPGEDVEDIARDGSASLEASLPMEPPLTPRTRSSVTVHAPRPRFEQLVVNPDYSFENFVAGPTNRLAHAAALAVAANPSKAYNPLFIHGGVGLGKTHLLQAICLKLVSTHPGIRLHYTSCEEFMNDFFESVQAGEMTTFRHRFRDVDVLIIDDIHFLTKRDRSQEEFFHTFNSLHQNHHQIIVSSDAPPEEIPDLEERLVSRFKWGLVAHVDAPDYETRIAILKAKARLRNMQLPDDVAEWMAKVVHRNIRELEGAIVKLQLHATVGKTPAITLDIARQAIGEPQPEDRSEPTIQNIIGVVTDFYDVRLADLQSEKRPRSIALPRHVCMYLARKCTRLSLEEIGGFFGGRDHTTVMHAVRTVEQKLAVDQEFSGTLRTLEDRARAVRAQGG